MENCNCGRGCNKPNNIKNEINELLESEDFYVLMQAYRHSKIENQPDVNKKFEMVKTFLRNNLKEIMQK